MRTRAQIETMGQALALAIPLVLIAWAPSADGDIWWHLAAGRQMVETGHPPHVDTLSAATSGRAWIDVHWLFQLVAYGLQQRGGLRALVIAKVVAIVAGAWLLLALVRKGVGPLAGWGLALVLPLALFPVRHLLLLRPTIVTLVFLAMTLMLLDAHRRGAPARTLLALVPLQVVWANCQGLSALGPALVAAFVLDAWVAGARSRIRALTPILAAVILALAATPYGVQGMILPLRLVARLAPLADNVYAANVVENVPPWTAERLTPGTFAHLPWALLVLVSSFVLARRRAGGLVLAHALVAAQMVGLALLANRNLLLLTWLGVPLVVINLVPFAAELVSRGSRLARGACAAAGFLLAVATTAQASRAFAHETPVNRSAPFRVPEGSVDLLARGPGHGEIFAADHHGGYLAWRLSSRFRPHVDTRLVLRSPAEFRAFLAVLDDPARFDDLQRRHGFAHVILPTAFPDRYLPLVRHLASSPGWVVGYTDGSEILFSPRGQMPPVDLASPSTIASLRADLGIRFADQPAVHDAAVLHLARLLLWLAHPERALQVVEGRTDHDARLVEARAYLVMNRFDDARARLAAFALDRDDVAALTLSAAIEAAAGRAVDALAFLRRALARAPANPEALALLRTLETQGASP